MRLVFLIGALACSVCSAAIAQTCETMTIRDPSGQIISNSVMCVDSNGTWADAASLNAANAPQPSASPIWETPVAVAPPPPPVVFEQTVQSVPLPRAAPAPQIIEEPIAFTPIPTPAPAAPMVAVQEPALLTPLPIAAPTPQILSEPVAYTPTPEPAPLPAAENWEPTSGAAKRKELYAKLGLVCNARKAMFCSDSNICTGRCEGKRGWCDGKTGEVHASLEKIERLNCRKKKRR